MKTRFRIIGAAVILLTLGLTIFLQQTGIVSADDITVTITGPEDPTNDDPIVLTITFNVPVTGFELEDIDVINGTANNLTGDEAVYTVEITPDPELEEGLVSVDIGEDVVEELNAPAKTFTIYYDGVAPTVTITSTSNDPTGNPLIPITLEFSEEIIGLTITEIIDAIENGVITYYAVGPEVISLVVQALDFDDVELAFPAGVFSDLAGNENEAIDTFSIEYIDQPWVAIRLAEGQEANTHLSPILFDVIFSEAVTDFDADDVVIEGTASGDLIAVVTGEEDRYTISVSGMTGPGTVIVTIPAGAAVDEDENESLASENIDNVVTYEGPVPSVVSIELLDVNPSKEESVSFFVTFSEDVDDVDEDDFELVIDGDLTGVSIDNVVGTGDQRVVSVLTGTGVGSIQLIVPEGASIVDDDEFSMIDLPYDEGPSYNIRIQSFTDVPITDIYWSWIERLSDSGLTAGCSVTEYCPDMPVTRAQMAIFLERGKRGIDFEPNPATGELFDDVASDDFAADWIELLFADSITAGCQEEPSLYCPDNPVTRAQMAIFLLKAKYGDEYEPMDVGISTGFSDVDIDDFAASWIKQLVIEDITAGCGGGNYCPDDPVTREQMAIFLVKTFDLP